MTEKAYQTIIIGGGPAGLAAAIYAARARLDVLVIEEPNKGSLLMAHKIDNYPGFVEGGSGHELYEKMKEQAKKFGAEFQAAKFLGMAIEGEEKTVHTNVENYKAKTVIIATGSANVTGGKKKKGEEEFLGKGVSYCATCDGAFTRNFVSSLFGEGDEVAEEALFLTRYSRKIFIFTPGKEFKAKENLVNLLKDNEKVTIVTDANLLEVQGDDYVNKVLVEVNGEREEFATDFVFVYLGTKNATELFGEFAELNEKGYIITNELMETKVEGVYAAGDVREKPVRQVTTAVADGTIAAMEAIKYMLKRKD
jgi:thioredoxin reductase (NADPH)